MSAAQRSARISEAVADKVGRYRRAIGFCRHSRACFGPSLPLPKDVTCGRGIRELSTNEALLTPLLSRRAARECLCKLPRL